jgi:Domain of unknown function (DUF5615)
MKLLLDENLPKKLKYHLGSHDVFHVTDKSWNGKKNGELLKLMLEDNFDALLTFDKNLQFQQNFDKYPIPVLILIAERNQYDFLSPLISKILFVLEKSSKRGPNIIQLS